MIQAASPKHLYRANDKNDGVYFSSPHSPAASRKQRSLALNALHACRMFSLFSFKVFWPSLRVQMASPLFCKRLSCTTSRPVTERPRTSLQMGACSSPLNSFFIRMHLNYQRLVARDDLFVPIFCTAVNILTGRV